MGQRFRRNVLVVVGVELLQGVVDEGGIDGEGLADPLGGHSELRAELCGGGVVPERLGQGRAGRVDPEPEVLEAARGGGRPRTGRAGNA